MSSHTPYTPEAIRAALNTTLLGQRIEVHPQVSSTNDLIREAARRGEPESLVIAADEQVKGRGRLGRTWSAPPGCCILCSVLLRPRFSPEQAFYLTIATSLAIYRACKTLLQEDKTSSTSTSLIPNPQPLVPIIKWPNDILIRGRKVAGVLCESEFTGGEWAFCVVGFGINVNIRPEDFGELSARATSLSSELGHSLDRAALLGSVLNELEALYLLLQGGQFSQIFNEWASALDTIGKRVSVSEPRGVLTGQALRVDEDGALVLRLDSGEEKRVLAGDVSGAGATNFG